MNSKEMFESLGYQCTIGTDFESYLINNDVGFLRIIFENEKRTLEIIDDTCFSHYTLTFEDLPCKVREAIYQRRKELGWHRMVRKYISID
jgi:hypothetical protein